MSTSNLPVACTLTPAEFRERRETVLDGIQQALEEVQEREDGYRYRFPGDDDTFQQLTHLVGLERRCCAFLTFRLTAEPDGGPLWLEITGPEGSKEFLAELFS